MLLRIELRDRGWPRTGNGEIGKDPTSMPGQLQICLCSRENSCDSAIELCSGDETGVHAADYSARIDEHRRRVQFNAIRPARASTLVERDSKWQVVAADKAPDIVDASFLIAPIH